MYNFQENILGKNLRQLRESRGLSLHGLGSLIGIEKSNISKYERGIMYPGIIPIAKIAKFYEVSIDSLLEEKEKDTDITIHFRDVRRRLTNEEGNIFFILLEKLRIEER